MTTPVQLGFQWLTGTGPRKQYFRAGDPMTTELASHKGVNTARAIMMGRLADGSWRADSNGGVANELGTGAGGVVQFIRDYTGTSNNLTATYLGSYSGTVTISNVKEHSAVLIFHITNTSNLASATHLPGYENIPGYGNWESFVNSIPGSSGPMSTM